MQGIHNGILRIKQKKESVPPLVKVVQLSNNRSKPYF